jgi:SAM-dependent methyltransferase
LIADPQPPVRDHATSLPPTAVAALLEAVRRGEPWRRALESIAVDSGAVEAIESIANEACGNWVWLTSFVGREAALDVGGAVSSMAPALSRHFRVVHHLEASALLAEFAAQRFAQDGLPNVTVSRGSAAALPFRDDAFDCMTLHGAIPRIDDGTRPAAVRAIFAECRRVLRPGGRVYIAFRNPVWYGRLADTAAWHDGERAIVPAARVAGFTELQRYYAFPTFDRPRVLVPATRRASYARETIEADGSIRRPARRAAALLGLYALLSPSVVIVARK